MLELQGITQVFGGVTALSNITCTIKPDAVTGVIGPNGAGKTTLFNIITGLYTQTHGSVLFKGENISGIPAEQLAKRGMIRTFQNIELFGTMTVLENVMIGLHSRSKSGLLACSFAMPWARSEERRIRSEAMEWLAFVGIESLASVQASNLPFGKGRLLEIARALATNPELLLLDEPAAGMNPSETEELGVIIKKARNDFDLTVLLIEHDMKFVNQMCDKVLVLDYGKTIFEGKPHEAIQDPEVIAAYLGDFHND